MNSLCQYQQYFEFPQLLNKSMFIVVKNCRGMCMQMIYRNMADLQDSHAVSVHSYFVSQCVSLELYAVKGEIFLTISMIVSAIIV